jgi:hypothetical protein
VALIMAGVVMAVVIAATGAPFWLVFVALLVAWLGAALTNLKVS